LKDEEVVQSQLELCFLDEAEGPLGEYLKKAIRLKALVLMQGFGINQPKIPQDAQDGVHVGGGNRDDQVPLRPQQVFTSLAAIREEVFGEVLEDSQHRDGIKHPGRKIHAFRKPPRHQYVAVSKYLGGEQRIDAYAPLNSRTEALEHLPVAGAHIQDRASSGGKARKMRQR
jgi:hypothetical protein